MATASKARKLTRTVMVTHPETGVVHTFERHKKLPKWAQPLVTNPAAFEPIDMRVIDASGQGEELLAHNIFDDNPIATVPADEDDEDDDDDSSNDSGSEPPPSETT